jgi:crotonobetainyl-CoA:carnitine CoA-transferase CaiB-like acyl-CoA transferase
MDGGIGLLLSPYRVLDLTDEKAFLCGRVLGDLGADVIKIEPPGGDPARRFGPFAGDGEDAERSLYWFAYNHNKRGVTLSLDHPQGREIFLRLAERADFVLESFPPGYLAERSLDYDVLAGRNAGLIHVSITAFGRTGPRASQRATDLGVWAAGGCLSLAGEREGEPLRVTVAQTPMWVGMHAAMGALLALAARVGTGRGQHVDVSAQESVMAALSHAPAFWDMLGENPIREGIYMSGRTVTGARLRVFWRCLDGFLNFIIYGGEAGRRTNRGLVAWMAERGAAPEWLKAVDWSTFDVRTCTQEEIDRLEAPIEAFFRTVTKEEFARQAYERGMLGYPVATAADLAVHPQLAAREFWRSLEWPEIGRSVPLPGPFARFSAASEVGPRRPAPRIGQHNLEVYREIGLDPEDLARLSAQGVV